MNLDVIEAMWTLRLLPSEQLPNVALSMINSEVENVPLQILAGLNSEDIDEAESLFKEGLEVLGRKKLTTIEAVRIYIRFVSSQILNTEISPYIGAKNIWEAALKVEDKNFHEADPFIYAASEYEDRPEDSVFFEQEICKEARRWISK